MRHVEAPNQIAKGTETFARKGVAAKLTLLPKILFEATLLSQIPLGR